VFFVWITVFSLFAVSVFWSFMADLYGSEQGKRLYGFIAAGGSAGALLGPLATVFLVKAIGPVNLLVVAALLIEAAIACAYRLERAAPGLKAGAEATVDAKPDSKGLGGGWLAGLAMVLRSPYLAGIALWVSLLSLAGTFLYIAQADVVRAASDDPAVRTRIFATIDLAVGVLQLIVQFLATGRLIARFGAGPAAAFLPLVFGAGFCVLAGSPVLGVVIAFQAIQRTANFALSNPAREILFTVLERAEKYKAKSVIDMVVFRGVDSASSLLYGGMRAIGMELPAISLATVPLMGAWLALSLGLGRAQERRARRLAGASGAERPEAAP
jgi:AAA family ATP:ADP antiporter